MTFDALHWGYRIIEEVSSVQTVVSLFEKKAALESALDRQQAMEDEEKEARRRRLDLAHKGLLEMPANHPDRYFADLEDVGLPDDKALIRDSRLRALMKGYETFRRQVVVIAVTYVELITEDFLKCVFTHRPERMYSYLNRLADQKGKIDLKEVLDAESKEALLDSLALKSARIAAQGKFRGLAKNLEAVTHRKFQAGLVNEIEGIIERRNRLVHEDSGDAVSSAEAVAALQSTIKLACDLARIALQCGIPATPWDMMGEDGVNIDYSYEIDGQLARSHAPFRNDVDSWISSVRYLGIESIICLLNADELDLYQGLPTTLPDYYQAAGFHVRHIPTEDHQQPPLTVERLSDVWLAYQKLPKPVLVHCGDGCNRTEMAVRHIQEQLSRA